MRVLPGIALLAALIPTTTVAAETPLDVSNLATRTIMVALESSSDVSVVGQTFGTPVPASYSVSGGTGTAVVSAADHEVLREFFIPPIPGSFSTIAIDIDLNTLEATSEATSGAFSNPPISLGFTGDPLDTQGAAGFISHPNVFSPVFCSSQAEVDALCATVPALCGAICTPVPGTPYDPLTGLVNLVGSETQIGCDGGVCQELVMFSHQGDLRLSEAASVPALGPAGLALLMLLVLATGVLALRRTATPPA